MEYLENNKIKIEIKSRYNGRILFEYEKANNTIKDTLKEAIKEKAYLMGANLEGADLYGADLRGAKLYDANLYGANLRNATLYGADLEGADLRGADLEKACLKCANLSGAYLKGANLEGANLEKADLERTCLNGACLFMTNDNIENPNKYIQDLTNNTNLKIKSTYLNKYSLSLYYQTYFKNCLIIDDYEIIKN